MYFRYTETDVTSLAQFAIDSEPICFRASEGRRTLVLWPDRVTILLPEPVLVAL
jgi:hypothetical protein